jgi:hypothetical protein
MIGDAMQLGVEGSKSSLKYRADLIPPYSRELLRYLHVNECMIDRRDIRLIVIIGDARRRHHDGNVQ